MIDTIKIRVDFIDRDKLLHNGMKWRQELDSDTGEIIPLSSNLENIRLSIYGVSLYIEGSLPKLLLGNNIETLKFEQIKEAIQIMEENTGLSLKDGIVTRLDLASTIEVDETINKYLPLLFSCPRFKRLPNTKHSLSFLQSKTALKFYDKVKEFKAREGFIPQKYQGKNLLRYELMLKKSSIKSILKGTLTVENLLTESTYEIFLEEWRKRYNSIIILRDIDETIVKTPTDFMDYLIDEKVKSMGYDNVISQINSLTDMSSKNKDRAKRKIKAVINKGYVKESGLVQELNRKVEQVYQNVKQELIQNNNGNNNS